MCPACPWFDLLNRAEALLYRSHLAWKLTVKTTWKYICTASPTWSPVPFYPEWSSSFFIHSFLNVTFPLPRSSAQAQTGDAALFNVWQLEAFCFSIRFVILSGYKRNSRNRKSLKLDMSRWSRVRNRTSSQEMEAALVAKSNWKGEKTQSEQNDKPRSHLLLCQCICGQIYCTWTLSFGHFHPSTASNCSSMSLSFALFCQYCWSNNVVSLINIGIYLSLICCFYAKSHPLLFTNCRGNNPKAFRDHSMYFITTSAE